MRLQGLTYSGYTIAESERKDLKSSYLNTRAHMLNHDWRIYWPDQNIFFPRTVAEQLRTSEQVGRDRIAPDKPCKRRVIRHRRMATDHGKAEVLQSNKNR